MNGDQATRRAAPRKILRTHASLFFVGGERLDVRTLDLSLGGMAVIAPAPLKIDAALALRCTLVKTTGKVDLVVQAKVVHCIYSGTHRGFVVGVKFVQPPPAAVDAIAKLLE